MITGHGFYNILSAVVPLYVSMILAYGSVKWWKIFTPVQCSGISKFVATFAVPFLSVEFISEVNPYKLNYLFIAADSISKVFVLIVLIAWAKFSKTRSIDWVITGFSILTLPNTLVIGLPLIRSMYGEKYVSIIVEVVVLQCVIWYTILLFLFEYREATVLVSNNPNGGSSNSGIPKDVESLEGVPENNRSEKRKESFRGVSGRSGGSCGDENDISNIIVSTPSCPSILEHKIDDSSSKLTPGVDVTIDMPISSSSSHKDAETLKALFNKSARARGDENETINVVVRTPSRSASMLQQANSGSTMVAPVVADAVDQGRDVFHEQMQASRTEDGNKAVAKEGGIEKPNEVEQQNNSSASPPSLIQILKRSCRKLARNPNVYASVLGLTWALISCRWDIRKPKILDHSITILSNTGLGMAMFSLGLFMALQPKFIACGKKRAAYGMLARFIGGPTVMAAASAAVGLKGDTLRVAILQAALPQGLVPFVFAKEYNLHPEILSTAVIFGIIVSLPTAIVYNILLGL